MCHLLFSFVGETLAITMHDNFYVLAAVILIEEEFRGYIE